MRHLTEKFTQCTGTYQNNILTDDENVHDTQHIKSFLLVFTCADI